MSTIVIVHSRENENIGAIKISNKEVEFLGTMTVVAEGIQSNGAYLAKNTLFDMENVDDWSNMFPSLLSNGYNSFEITNTVPEDVSNESPIKMMRQ